VLLRNVKQAPNCLKNNLSLTIPPKTNQYNFPIIHLNSRANKIKNSNNFHKNSLRNHFHLCQYQSSITFIYRNIIICCFLFLLNKNFHPKPSIPSILSLVFLLQVIKFYFYSFCGANEDFIKFYVFLLILLFDLNKWATERGTLRFHVKWKLWHILYLFSFALWTSHKIKFQCQML